MSLYDLTKDVYLLQTQLEEDDSNNEELNQKIADTFADFDDSVEVICKVIRNLESEAQAFKAEKDRLAERERVVGNNAKRLKEYLKSCLQLLGLKKVKSGIFSVTRCESQSVEVVDEAALPTEFKEPQPDKVLKTLIAKALKIGDDVPGAALVVNEYLRIR